jgi:hypothetical protein
VFVNKALEGIKPKNLEPNKCSELVWVSFSDVESSVEIPEVFKKISLAFIKDFEDSHYLELLIKH